MAETPERDGIVDENYIETRAELAQFLRPSAFPADATELRAVARDNNATGTMLRLLDQLPTDQLFHNTQEIVAALGDAI